MNRNDNIERVVRFSTFTARHFLAVIVTIVAACTIWTVTYFALMGWAVLSNGGLGSPASYPLGLLVLMILCPVLCLILFLPSTAAAEWLVRQRSLPTLAQIPICLSIFAALCLALVSIVSSIRPPASLEGISVGFGAVFLLNLLPLGIYWWTAQSGPLVLKLARSLGAAFRPQP